MSEWTTISNTNKKYYRMKQVENSINSIINQFSSRNRNIIIKSHYTFSLNLHMDSIDFVDMIVYMCDEFDIDIRDNEVSIYMTVNDLVAIIMEKLGYIEDRKTFMTTKEWDDESN